MKIVVCAPDELIHELNDVKQHFITCSKEEVNDVQADLLLYLFEDGAGQEFQSAKNILINSVADCLPDIGNQNKLLRMNGWPGFVQRSVWEVAGEINTDVAAAAALLGKKLLKCADQPGFVSARILAMIINEAWFAKEEDISSENEIDIAMKLGTGYPYGPFEWGNKIGLSRITGLLQALSIKNNIYTPAQTLSSAI